jgi:3-methyladenine DNA glycosylase/8-oxoguanine DNA glycosylase
MLIDMMKDVEHKAGEAASPPEPRRLAAADKEVVQQLVARLRRQILQEIAEATAAGWTG